MPLDLEQLIHEAAGRIDEAGSLEQLDAVRVDFLGKKGKLTGVLKSIGSLPAEEKPAATPSLQTSWPVMRLTSACQQVVNLMGVYIR